MPSDIAIESVVNPKTGTGLDVQLSSPPSGSLAWAISRTPYEENARPTTATDEGGGLYRVAVFAPVLWYVWATDGTGTVDLPGAATASPSDSPVLDLCGDRLRQIMEDNAAGLNSALTAWTGTPSTVKRFVYGSATAITDFPAVLVTAPSFESSMTAMPYFEERVLRLEIHFYILHQDPLTYLPLVNRLTAAGLAVFNQQFYNRIVLDDGTPVTDCYCRSGNTTDVEVEEDKWVAVGSLVWQGSVYVQDVTAEFFTDVDGGLIGGGNAAASVLDGGVL